MHDDRKSINLWEQSMLKNHNIYHLFNHSNAAEEEIASRSEAISDGAERVLKFSILYTHPHTPTHTPLHKTLLRTYICGGVKEFRFCILGAKFGAKNVLDFYLKVLAKNLPRFTAFQNFFFLKKIKIFTRERSSKGLLFTLLFFFLLFLLLG
jgi:hypothetical protein